MVATPLIIMMLAIFEYALAFLVMVTLDNATRSAARQIRTGEAQTASVSASTFKSMVCDKMTWLSKTDCTGNLQVDARVFSSFASSGAPDPTSNGSFDSTKLKFDLGGPGQIIVVTSYYKWKLISTALLSGLSSTMFGTGNFAATASSAFRNEPYGS